MQWYDYGARNYDPALGRWMNVDKLAEDPNQISKSPYAYAWNDPIKLNDPDGNCPTCIFGAIVGAAVDYGLQVATNYAEGKTGVDAWTDNINLTTIATSAAVGFVTQGESGASALVKGTVKVGSAIVNNTIEVNTTEGVKVETNLVNIEKNAMIDLAAGKITKKIGKKTKNIISKAGQTKAGKLNKTGKKIVKSMGKHVTRKRTENIKSGLKKVGEYSKKSVETTIKYVTKKPKASLKKNTDL